MSVYTNEDCMAVMARYPDKYFDIAIVDPPYGIGDFNNTASKKLHKKIEWNNTTPTIEYFKELHRVSKHRIIWGFNYYSGMISDVGVIVHDKTGGGIKKFPSELSECDIASHSFGVNMKIFHFVSNGNVCGKNINWDNVGENKRIHPCQKPRELYEWLVKKYCKPGWKVLDTHVGSASSLIAYEEAGLEYVGCELDADYFKASTKRLNEYKSQLRMI